MIEAAALYAMLMLTLFAWCGIIGLVFVVAWVKQRVPWEVLVFAALITVWAFLWGIR